MLIGTPHEWGGAIDSLVPDILNLVIESWDAIRPLSQDSREDPTTEELCRLLRLNRNSNNLPFRIDIQLVDLDPAADEDQGRMDIVFSPLIPDERIYFCLECKRLNVVKDGKTRSYASEYITHGMLRFICGQYASAVHQGGMLGYVLDGNVAPVIMKIKSLIQSRSEELKVNELDIFLPSRICPENLQIKESLHERHHGLGFFCIHHIFVPVVSD